MPKMADGAANQTMGQPIKPWGSTDFSTWDSLLALLKGKKKKKSVGYLTYVMEISSWPLTFPPTPDMLPSRGHMNIHICKDNV